MAAKDRAPVVVRDEGAGGRNWIAVDSVLFPVVFSGGRNGGRFAHCWCSLVEKGKWVVREREDLEQE